jgi:hypothetical protein
MTEDYSDILKGICDNLFCINKTLIEILNELKPKQVEEDEEENY